ncbi:MAG: ABC transporter ATP-binding protein/permease [Pseudoflavonifractor capillosus]|uniref:ABC transporter ATP-binding protein n=1 Tax=Pseudoflavonifractor capillosus TaxID=106588 RepID=UPI0023F9D217|nr:ABC transporter ATP-binding protein [Pseudoflavonifractor capillosus]MCI5928923.1 ABC transporter ATP-binding protein/permease [Pseudoflavonifractor capillosus]MDY4661685.1 ABC transporter ATP-binding protein [Pseudoflavonifractor capillosus]
MEEKKKSPYNMWQNTGFMLSAAWHNCPSVIFLCVALAVVTAAQTVAELLIAPAVIAKVEESAPLESLLLTIAGFSLLLLLLSGLKRYLDTNTLFGRVHIRMKLARSVGLKVSRTSYPNLMDARFSDLEYKAVEAFDNNDSAAEHIWTTWTTILTNLLGFAVYLAILSGLHPLLFCVIAVTAAVGYFVDKKISGWGYRHREEAARPIKEMYYIRKTATGRPHAKDIRMFGLGPWMNEVWRKSMSLFRAFLRRRESVYLWINLTDLLLTLIRNGAAYAYLLWLTLTTGMSAAEFLLYFTAASGFTQWVTGILDMFNQLHRESLDISTVREYLEYPELFRFEDGEPLPKDLSTPCEIRLENVSFRYPKAEKDTLHHINLTIHPGEKLAIVGLNGAGKTTLVRLVCGFLDPTEGRVLLNGEDIRRYNRRAYYELFSAVFQDFSVLEASVAENVAQRVEGIDTDRVMACLDQAGLTEKVMSLPKGVATAIGRQVFEDGVELSGGQTQRLMLARALYKDGPILVLDEPTAALDPIAEEDIYQKYSGMTGGKTSLFISHRLASTRFCDRILFLEQGRIAEEGTHSELLTRGGGYAKLFDVQSQYYREGGEHHGE